jgi:hypothetical protein
MPTLLHKTFDQECIRPVGRRGAGAVPASFTRQTLTGCGMFLTVCSYYIFVGERELISNLVVNCTRYADAAGFRQTFQAGGH